MLGRSDGVFPLCIPLREASWARAELVRSFVIHFVE